MKKTILITASLLLLAAGCNFNKTTQKENQNQQVTQVSNSLDLQQKCATAAANYFTNNGFKAKDGFDYQNHYNTKQNKCFILVRSYNPKDDFLSMDLYDALEGKRYAVFVGHQICDQTSLLILKDPKRCQLDGGDIWLDGNDTKNPSDIHVGFGGLKNGGVGDETTLKQFMERIQPLMAD